MHHASTWIRSSSWYRMFGFSLGEYTSRFKYGLLLSVCTTLIFPCSTLWTLSCHWPIDIGGWSAQQLARHSEISNARLKHSSSLFSALALPRQGTYLETRAHTGRFVLLISNTAWQQNFVIHKIGSKWIFLAALHAALHNISPLYRSCLKPILLIASFLHCLQEGQG